MIKILSLVLILVSGSAWAGYYFTPEQVFPVKTEPCDLVACAEAWSVTRGLTKNYAGPLFQLNNGSSTLDIGQVGGVADMSTWSAFCSGVASNCTISKVYAQIHTTSNDLTPFNAGVGGRSVFTIEAATGLPLWISNNSGQVQTGGQQYTVGGASDNAATGITAAGTSETVLMNVKPVEQPNGYCCGMFGTSHIYSCCATTGGGNFLIAAGQGNVPPGDGVGCATALTYCFGLDEECCFTSVTPSDGGDYTVKQFPGAVMAASFDSSAYKLVMYVNGFAMTNETPACNSGTTPPCTLNSGLRVHYGGGGDLTGPELIEARELLITNSALTQAQIKSIVNSAKLFYPGVNFPTGPNNPAIYAAGPGDVVAGAKYFNGLRAYTAALAAAGTQPLIAVENKTSTDSCWVLPNAAGGLGNTTSCTNSGENGQPVQSFCTSVPASDGRNQSPGNDCWVVVSFDQVGFVANYANIGGAAETYVQYCINFTPCTLFVGSGQLGGTITLSSTSQPYTFVAVVERTDSTAEGFIVTHETGNNQPGALTAFGGSANQVFMETNSGGTFPSITASGVTENNFHALDFIFNAAASSIVADGVVTTGTVGTDVAGTSPTIRWGNSVNAGSALLNGQIAETGLYPFGLTLTQQANLRANQRAYWGF